MSDLITGHIGIVMPISDDKVILMTVVDRETLPVDCSVGKLAINTSNSIYSNMLPQMILRTDEIVEATELQGMGAAGILKSDIWAIKKYKGLFAV